MKWTAEAERWLREIFEFIAPDNPAAARRTVLAIYEKAELLARFPEIGYVHQHGRDVRVLLYGHYRIAYRIRSGDVEILGVFHGALDLERLL